MREPQYCFGCDKETYGDFAYINDEPLCNKCWDDDTKFNICLKITSQVLRLREDSPP